MKDGDDAVRCPGCRQFFRPDPVPKEGVFEAICPVCSARMLVGVEAPRDDAPAEARAKLRFLAPVWFPGDA